MFSRDGSELLAGGSQTKVERWSLDQNKLLGSFGGRTGDEVKLALSHSGNEVFATDGRTVEAYVVATGKLLWTVGAHQSPVFDLSRHPSLPILATAGGDDTVALIDSSQGNLIRTLHLAPTSGDILQVDFTPDGRLLAAAMSNGAVVIMNEPWP